MKDKRKRPVKGVIFDFDGTLVDSMPLWQEIDRLFLAERGLEVPEGLGTMIAGFSFTETAHYFKKTFALKESVEEIKERWKTMSRSLYPLHVTLKPGCREVLEDLGNAGFCMAIGSSNNKDVIEELLEREGLSSHFISVMTSCDAGKGKPYPDLFLFLAREMGLAPSEISIVDDIIEGIRAGKRAGMTTIAVYDKGYGKRKLLEKEADHYIISLYELPPLLGDGPFTS